LIFKAFLAFPWVGMGLWRGMEGPRRLVGNRAAPTPPSHRQPAGPRPLPARPHRGQRNNSGLWWLSKSGRHVGFELWLERDHLALMDFGRSIVDVTSQPFWLLWSG